MVEVLNDPFTDTGQVAPPVQGCCRTLGLGSSSPSHLPLKSFPS